MKHSHRILLAALVAAIALPLAASAAKKDDKKKAADPAEAFATLDKDNDGFVSKVEYLGLMKSALGEDVATTRFAALDKNGDGKLSKEEFAASPGGKKEKKPKKKKN